MSTSSIGSSAIFSGTSRFSSDFQQVIDRAVSIASLPGAQLTAGINTLQSQSSALSTLRTSFSALQSAIAGLNSAVKSGSLQGTVDDSSIAQATVTSGALPATFTLEVTSLGSYSNAISSTGAVPVSDPSSQSITSSSSLTLSVGDTSVNITPESPSLNSLVDAINNSAGLGVEASVVNLGSSGSPDYRLSVRSSKLGPVSIQLNDGTDNLLSSLTPGSLASYKVDGIATPITSDSRTVTLAPGVSLSLLGQSTTGVSTTVTVSQQTNSIANALAAFTNAYNTAADQLAANRGQSGSALQGQSIVTELSGILGSLTNYSSGGSGIGSLTDLGLTFNDTNGRLTFDPTAFHAAADSNQNLLSKFLGDASTGGFLQFASNLVGGASDPDKGLIQTTNASLASQISSEQALQAASQARVDQLKQSLQQQLAKSDALVASLEQSYTVLTGIFQAQQINAQSKL